MKHHSILVAIVIFVLIIAGMFVFAFLKKSEIAEAPEVTPKTESISNPYDWLTRIDAKHFVNNRNQAIAGEILFPSMCDLLDWEVVQHESSPDRVTIAFSVINNAVNCDKAEKPQRFLVSFEAASNVVIDATVNGHAVELNLIPASPGENPDNFELFLKG